MTQITLTEPAQNPTASTDRQLPATHWDRIIGLRNELTNGIVKLLQRHNQGKIEIPDDYENNAAYVMWVDGDGYAYDGRVKTVSLYGDGISLYVEDNDGNHSTLYSGTDIGCDHIEWLATIFDMLQDLLTDDKWRICSECGRLIFEGYTNQSGEPAEFYCSDECLYKHYDPEEWARMCQGPEGEEDRGNDFCLWTQWY